VLLYCLSKDQGNCSACHQSAASKNHPKKRKPIMMNKRYAKNNKVGVLGHIATERFK